MQAIVDMTDNWPASFTKSKKDASQIIKPIQEQKKSASKKVSKISIQANKSKLIATAEKKHVKISKIAKLGCEICISFTILYIFLQQTLI